jgi:hypothetical protein
MILRYKITLKELSKSGKEFNWPKHFCECCQRNMWGHGYVTRYFTEIANSVFIKRYRCPDCKDLVIVRPEEYWSGIRSSILAIYLALKSRLSSGRWPFFFPRQRGNHWLNRFIVFARMELKVNLPEFLDRCHSKQIRFLP